METGKHFDEHIKRAMESLESTPGSGAWELFEQQLAEAEMAEADDLLRERLGDFEAAPQPGSWAAMEQLIEADEAAEAIENEVGIDSLAQEKLSNFSVPYQSEHWALMARRLEDEQLLRQAVHQYKISEIVIVALLLLTFVRFTLETGTSVSPAAKWEQQQIHSPENQQTPSIGPASEGQDKTQDADGQSELLGKPIAITPPGVSGENLSAVDLKNLATVTQAEMPKIETSTHGRQEKSQGSASSLESVPLLSASSLQSSTDHKSSIEKIAEKTLDSKAFKAGMEKKNKKSPALLPAKKTGHVQSKFSWEELPGAKTTTFKKPNNLRFSIFTTTDVNYVETPADQLSVFDTLVKTAPHKTLAMGYGAGILMSLKKEKMEFQAGGIYSFKRYIPNTPVFLFETLNFYVREDFNGIQLDILQVPLSMNYHFKDQGKWRFYASGGVAGHFIASSIYEIEYDQTPSFGPSSLLPPPPSGPDDLRTIRDEKEFPEGLLGGGQLNKNFYLSFNIGAGVERYISQKWVLFFQPNYQHYLLTNGVGTNNDKIYTTSFYFGTKFSLK